MKVRLVATGDTIVDLPDDSTQEDIERAKDQFLVFLRENITFMQVQAIPQNNEPGVEQ